MFRVTAERAAEAAKRQAETEAAAKAAAAEAAKLQADAQAEAVAKAHAAKLRVLHALEERLIQQRRQREARRRLEAQRRRAEWVDAVRRTARQTTSRPPQPIPQVRQCLRSHDALDIPRHT